MKKKYIIPTLQLTHINVEHLIADSFKINSGTTVDQQYVKGESSSTSRYNVWDDDWSAE
ncbi:MAG: hypothetical protein IJ142_08290 [Bacteroidaceae bacterium]|nr:hypothetical protein [Bacteroidaceae bacterium]